MPANPVASILCSGPVCPTETGNNLPLVAASTVPEHSPAADLLVSGGDVVTMNPGREVLVGGTVAIAGDRILDVGSTSALRAAHPDADVLDASGCVVTPGLVDAHTHLVYGGDRANEFEMRLAGASYEDIARAGGGIRSTVAATRASDDAALYDAACARALQLMADGVTTVEVKSGYVYLNEEIAFELKRDAWLVKQGWSIRWHFKRGSRASKPLLEALEKAGILVTGL